MTITTPDLTQLDPTTVATFQAEILARLQAAFPGLDFGRGVLGDRVLYLSAVLGAALRAEIAQLQASTTLAALQASAATADPASAAALLSNYFVSPSAGTVATGEATIVMASNAPLVVASGATFSAGGAALATTGAIAVRSSAATIASATDVVLTPVSGGAYAFTIPLQTTTPGAVNIPLGTPVSPDQPPPGFVSAYAASNFTGGQSPQSPTALASALLPGAAARVWSNRATITAMIQSQPQFAAVAGLAIIGAGSPELTRGRHGAFPVPVGGKCDVYVRSSPTLQVVTVPVTATLLSVGPAGGSWQFALGAAAAPGFYRVTSIIPAGSTNPLTGFPPSQVTLGYDLSAASPAPDIVNATEAAFTAFSTAVVQFTDTSTPTIGLAAGASAPYTAVVTASILVGPMQSYLTALENAAPGVDVVTRGAVPCVVRVAADVNVPAGATVDAGAVSAAMAAAVGAMGVGGSLYASTLAAAAAGALPAGAAFGAVRMFGVVQRPDGVSSYVSSAVVLTAPELPDVMTTPNTVAFFLDAGDVAINVL